MPKIERVSIFGDFLRLRWQELYICSPSGRGVRVAEGARLESVYRGNSIAGSNPALSAVKSNLLPKGAFFYCYMLSFINFKYFFIRIKHVF